MRKLVAEREETCLFCQTFSAAETTKPIRTTEDALVYLDHFRDKKQEYFVCLSLDGDRRLIARRVVTVGLLDMAITHPREVFAAPLTDHAASVIIAHNHPSRVASPSKADIKTTQQLVAAAQILGIHLWDHIIVAKSGHYSFRDEGML